MSYSTEFRLSDTVGDLPVPVLGKWCLYQRSTGDLILQGSIQVLTPGMAMTSCSQGKSFRLAYGDQPEGSGWLTGNAFSIRSSRLSLGESSFEDLVKRGSVLATLVIEPSVEVARKFDDVDEFWGGTLSYDVVFSAVNRCQTDKQN